ncbi:putative ankyrin repeat domain-containing protein 32-like isoform X1 [Trypanosoma conorhini]|uniref:Putative ankyrin repeat domain-containing protein 32-like isoform X1 n=1 Tax=Trypanosoma conorhini TaxID=83891 RepID=A0A3R7MMC4_9TRYP|nr:putative ankyrin repeat domain-containing protein 32-like isoform X1 [Trypanosoma conorhini]RNF17549.1 putative ankyrin repeat domain-containing protein 32-like isoform X1 [Trypanosoma conorhini]
MVADSAPPASRLAYQNLLQALVYERKSINDAYDSLWGIVSRNLADAAETTSVKNVLHGLTGMLRFIFERLYQHTSQTALTFVKEIGGAAEGRCSGTVAALYDAIKAKMVAPRVRRGDSEPQPTSAEEGGEKVKGGCQNRYVFAISSHYAWETQLELLEVLLHRFNCTTVVLRRCEAGREPSVAQQLGCNFLVSPQAPTTPCAILHATREKLLQYANPSVGDEVDDELDELLRALDTTTARPSASLTEAATVKSPVASAPVVSRNVPRSELSSFPQQAMNLIDTHPVTTCPSTQFKELQPCTHATKRPRAETVHTSPAIFSTLAGSPTELSQVIHYQREPSAKAAPLWSASDTDKFLLDPSQWRFQVSNSLKDLKDEVISSIRLLGGRVDNGKRYNPQTTHLIVAERLAERTEKYLSCCAALKYIVSPRYVFDSARRGNWIVDRLHEYDENPLRRLPASPAMPPFRGWRVVLFTSSASVDAGIATVLRAGGCTDTTSYVFDAAHTPAIDYKCIEYASHLLVECEEVSQTGRFLIPTWFPHKLKRQDHRLFSLELLLHLLCFCHSPVFGEGGRLINIRPLPPSCLLDIP